MSKYNYLDLFHGIGGFALSAYWAGMKFEKHYCSDIEKFTVELYKKRFPDSIQLGNIEKIDFEKLKKENENGWIITGGFPCQDLSLAGKQKGLIDEKTKEKTRSGLWYDYLRAIGILRPKFAIIENVTGLIISGGLGTCLEGLAKIGYNAEWQTISARQVGAWHRRERVWIIAYPDKVRREWISKEQILQKHDIQGKFKGGFEKFRKRPYLPGSGNCGTVNGLPGQVDRIKGLGNSIVPQIAEILFYKIKPYL